MNSTSKVSLQGIYKRDSTIYYIAWNPVGEYFKIKKLHIGTPVGSYSSMNVLLHARPFNELGLIPIYLGHLLPDTIPSDLYPELFI